MERVVHGFEPVYDEHSKILIVGTMPSVLSRKQSFYYGNPQNRFYGVLSRLLGCKKPETVEEKIHMLLSHGIAVYDVLKSCDIAGSADSSIKNARPNDFSPIFDTADIKRVFANGQTAYKYYIRFVGEAEVLPSTSPANAAFGMDRLIDAWAGILQFIK